MKDLDYAVEQMVRCLDIDPDEVVTIIGDSTTSEIIEPAKAILQPEYAFDLDDYERPLTSVPEDLAEALRDSDFVFYNIDKKAKDGVDELDFRREMNRIAEEKGRVGSLLAVSRDMLIDSFNYDAYKIRDFTLRLRDYMKKVSAVELTTELGTRMIFEFDHDAWHASTGFIEKRKPGKRNSPRNVMGAEIYTKPVRSGGRLYIDGMYGMLVTQDWVRKDPQEALKRLAQNPIIWDVEGKTIRRVYSADPQIMKTVHDYVMSHPEMESNFIDEFGMGTNLGMKILFANVMHDEKFPGVHVANGNKYDSLGNDRYVFKKSLHSDGVMRKSTLRNLDDSKYIMKNGIYVLNP